MCEEKDFEQVIQMPASDKSKNYVLKPCSALLFHHGQIW
jgi:hypothetical protein